MTNKIIPYEKSFASHEKAQYWSDKNELKPNEVFKFSHKKFYFDCDKCTHNFYTYLSSISQGIWCPYCNGHHRLCDEEDCKECYEKSFSSHEKAQYWNDKNKVKPRNVFKNSNKKYLLNCNKCNHTFSIALNNINTGYWCPYCANKKLCDEEDCKECYEKSFASHDKSKYLINNKLEPRYIFKCSNDKYNILCNICNHIFNITISKITSMNRWCSYCANKKLCGNDNCNVCFEKSFASHKKSKYWSNVNELLPIQIFKSSNKKFIFNCNKGHKFISALNHVTNNKWCPYCVNKTEQKLYDKLSTLYPTLQQQFKVEWCKNKTFLPFDFVIPENKIIIELDGRQHFEQVRNWDDPKKTQENDKYKMKCANDNNYSVIRILQEDVFYDSYDWLSELNDNIKNIIKNKKVENIYMCKDNEYDVFN
jgi:very-short-patch-repair endonuclease